jgi:hypothetical protein
MYFFGGPPLEGVVATAADIASLVRACICEAVRFGRLVAQCRDRLRWLWKLKESQRKPKRLVRGEWA